MATLEARLARGFDVLRQREEAGDTGGEYPRWLAAWLDLLGQYEQATVRG